MFCSLFCFFQTVFYSFDKCDNILRTSLWRTRFSLPFITSVAQSRSKKKKKPKTLWEAGSELKRTLHPPRLSQ